MLGKIIRPEVMQKREKRGVGEVFHRLNFDRLVRLINFAFLISFEQILNFLADLSKGNSEKSF